MDFHIKLERLCLTSHFQPSLIFVGEVRSLPQSGAPRWCFTQVGSGLTCIHKTRLERLARDKHSSLLQKSVNYGHKKFYSTSPCAASIPQPHIVKSLFKWSLVRCFSLKVGSVSFPVNIKNRLNSFQGQNFQWLFSQMNKLTFYPCLVFPSKAKSCTNRVGLRK